ncbi:MAG: hypothetical protein N2167_06225 [Flavobacteriales bacterium]|nr:hypothetical protein [Flavobacteriales bacterium]
MKKYFVFFFFTWLGCILFSGCLSEKKAMYSIKNPWGLEVWLHAPNYSIDLQSANDTLWILVRNHYSQPITLQSIDEHLFKLYAYPRFYKKKSFEILAHTMQASTLSLQPGDVKALGWITEQELLLVSNWKNKKNISPTRLPMLVNAREFEPYIQMKVEVKVQDKFIRSKETLFSIDQTTIPTETYQKAILSISADEPEILPGNKKKENIIRCRVKNTSNYDQYYFENSGSVRFNLYGYSKNRTAVMVLRFKEEYFQRNRKIILKPGEEKEIFAENLYSLFYKELNPSLPFYWEWNKKKEPISPLYYSNGKPTYETEVWFGIIIDGREYLSPSYTLRVVQEKKSK